MLLVLSLSSTPSDDTNDSSLKIVNSSSKLKSSQTELTPCSFFFFVREWKTEKDFTFTCFGEVQNFRPKRALEDEREAYIFCEARKKAEVDWTFFTPTRSLTNRKKNAFEKYLKLFDGAMQRAQIENSSFHCTISHVNRIGIVSITTHQQLMLNF